MTTDLKVPSVADLVAALLTLPQDAKVIVIDPDTGGHFDRIHVGPANEHRWSPGDAEIMAIWIDYHDNR